MLLKLKNLFNHQSTRKISQNSLDKLIKASKSDGNLALVSLSNDIFYNLAFENYLAETNDLKNRNILLIWKTEPTIVIGRHQNPWFECDVKEALSSSVKIARRYSGGGCVYHDFGNLNISFITHRSKYDREFNLKLIKETLETLNFNGLSFEISPRHDIFIKNLNDTDNNSNNLFKISGSASRLANKFSYHHCTLLFDSNINKMRLLKSKLRENIITKATPSVRSQVKNLKQFSNDSSLNISTIIQKLCEQFWRYNSSDWSLSHLFSYINPEDENIKELTEKHLSELKSWEYIYGTTPKFQLKLDLNGENSLIFNVSNGFIKDYEIKYIGGDLDSFRTGLELFKGCRLDKNDLVNVFINNPNLVNSNLNFIRIFEFLNKNF